MCQAKNLWKQREYVDMREAEFFEDFFFSGEEK